MSLWPERVRASTLRAWDRRNRLTPPTPSRNGPPWSRLCSWLCLDSIERFELTSLRRLLSRASKLPATSPGPWRPRGPALPVQPWDFGSCSVLGMGPDCGALWTAVSTELKDLKKCSVLGQRSDGGQEPQITWTQPSICATSATRQKETENFSTKQRLVFELEHEPSSCLCSSFSSKICSNANFIAIGIFSFPPKTRDMSENIIIDSMICAITFFYLHQTTTLPCACLCSES